MTNPFQHVKRKQFTPQQRARIFAERGGICGWVNAGKSEGCGRKLRPGDSWRLEHGDALEKGGNNDEAGIGISCEWCWPAKDAEDHADAGHFRRAYTRHVVPSEFRRSKSWGRR
jgi:hypothetical protein